MTALDVLQAMQVFQQQQDPGPEGKPFRIATIASDYDAMSTWPAPAPFPRVVFEGEEAADAGVATYAYLFGYVPRPLDRVVLAPVGTTYVILGKVPHLDVNDAPTGDVQGFWRDVGGTAGVELGGSSYFDSDTGLNLTTDADIAGDVAAGGQFLHGPRDNRVPEIQFNSYTYTSVAGAAMTTPVITFPVAWPVGAVPVVHVTITGGSGSHTYAMARPSAVTNTGFQVVILKTDAARADFAGGVAWPLTWVAFARPADA